MFYLCYTNYVGRLPYGSRPFCVVGQVGLEPTMVKPADLQSAAIATRRLSHMAEAGGLEPPDGFLRRFSGPVRYQLRSILPYVVRATGFEPATTRLKVGCSNPTELRSHIIGGARRTRI